MLILVLLRQIVCVSKLLPLNSMSCCFFFFTFVPWHWGAGRRGEGGVVMFVRVCSYVPTQTPVINSKW